jgi:hypothetical protein
MKKLLLIATILLTGTQTITAQRYRGFEPEYPKFRIGLQGGWSYRIAELSPSIPPAFRSYVKELKSGINYGADASYFITRSIGLGLKYSGYRSENELNSIYITDSVGKIRYGKMRDDITIQYIGPSLNTRVMSESETFHFVSSFSVGYLSYKNNVTVVDNFTHTGSTVGVVAGIAFDFAVHPNIFLGADITATMGALSSYEEESATGRKKIELKENERESLSRIDISAGVKFNF